MCFSATASFVAGISLAAIGVVTVRRARRKTDLPFALIPLLFGIQQIIEGMLWLSFSVDAPAFKSIMAYAFSVFSHTLWPIFVPFAIAMLEPEVRRRHMILALQAVGLGIGLYLLYFIVRYPLTAVADEHIVYVTTYFSKLPAMTLYLAATCLVCLVSSHRLVRVFGVLTLLFFFIAYWFYAVALFSVWCYFSAVLSAIIFLYFRPIGASQPGLATRSSERSAGNP